MIVGEGFIVVGGESVPAGDPVYGTMPIVDAMARAARSREVGPEAYTIDSIDRGVVCVEPAPKQPYVRPNRASRRAHARRGKR